jgi:hypothetical protein
MHRKEATVILAEILRETEHLKQIESTIAQTMCKLEHLHHGKEAKQKTTPAQKEKK